MYNFYCRESDLEEVLSLQTRMHNSAGVFLDPARRSRGSTLHHHHHTSPGGSSTGQSSVSISSSGSRPRTPTASPHGSPRKARRSPSHGKMNIVVD